MGEGLSRRDMMKWTALAAGAAGIGAATSAPAQTAQRKRSVRLAHLTDMHIQPELRAPEGVAACLDHAMALANRPELVITGGDLIMDGFAQERARTALQWDLLTKVFRDHCAVPVTHTLGNHDIWGWNQRLSKTTSAESEWGKRWALDVLGMTSASYGIDRGAWRLIVLDGVQPRGGDGYTAHLDEAQLEWLRSELEGVARAGRHAALFSHIPILSMAAVEHDGRIRDGDRSVPGGVMHTDASALCDLFEELGCVKLCVSGHIHKLDRVEYRGVTCICDGAVSGAWWRGREDRCDEGYGVFDLYEDGSFAHEYVKYGWVAADDGG